MKVPCSAAISMLAPGPGGRLRVGRSAEKFAVLRLSLEQLGDDLSDICPTDFGPVFWSSEPWLMTWGKKTWLDAWLDAYPYFGEFEAQSFAGFGLIGRPKAGRIWAFGRCGWMEMTWDDLEISRGNHLFQFLTWIFRAAPWGLAVEAVVYRLHQEAHCEAKSGRYFGGSSLQTSWEMGRLSPSLPLRLPRKPGLIVVDLLILAYFGGSHGGDWCWERRDSSLSRHFHFFGLEVGGNISPCKC